MRWYKICCIITCASKPLYLAARNWDVELAHTPTKHMTSPLVPRKNPRTGMKEYYFPQTFTSPGINNLNSPILKGIVLIEGLLYKLMNSFLVAFGESNPRKLLEIICV